MTRSFGDRIAASIGVCAEPDVVEAGTGFCDQIILLASDGLWEFVSSAEAVRVAAAAEGNAKKAAQDLLKMATGLWQENEEGVDDITIIVVVLKGDKCQ